MKRTVEIYKWDQNTPPTEGGVRGSFVLEGVGTFVQYGTDMLEFESGGCTFSTAIIEMPDGEVRNVPLSGSHKIKFKLKESVKAVYDPVSGTVIGRHEGTEPSNHD